MSFYAKIKTELANKKYIIAAIEELKKRGELTNYQLNEKKEKIEIDRQGDMLTISKEKAGSNFEVSGDSRVVNSFTNRLKQLYAYESIKDNLPLDFEISKESEEAGEIIIHLKG